MTPVELSNPVYSDEEAARAHIEVDPVAERSGLPSLRRRE